jgi:hypothetical protein
MSVNKYEAAVGDADIDRDAVDKRDKQFEDVRLKK